jgi:hypothetical protein
MRHKFLIRILGKAVAAGALLGGVTAVVPQAAHASVTAFYVAPAVDGGNDQGGANNCTLAASPCATIKQALSEASVLSANTPGTVINLSRGTFTGAGNDFTLLTNATYDTNLNNITINGSGTKGKKASVVEPTVCPSVTNGTLAGDTALVDLEDVSGVTIQNIDLNGALAVTSCSNYQAGVVISNATFGDAVVGDLIQSGATYGILTDDHADSTIISNNLAPVLCSGTVKGPNTGLNAGWSAPANLKVKVPKCAQFVESGHGAFTGVFINSVFYCAQPSAGKGFIVLTGSGSNCSIKGPGVEIAKGATVVFNTSVSPFTQFGIACNSPIGPTYATQVSSPTQATTCAISDNTVTAGGTVYHDTGTVPPLVIGGPTTLNVGSFSTPGGECNGIPPIGIVGTGGAAVNVDSNTVSNVSDSISECPEAGETTNDGVGIGFIPNIEYGASAGDGSVIGVNEGNNPATGDGNKLSGNDNGIVVHGSVPEPSSPLDGRTQTYQVNGNTVSSASSSGITLQELGWGMGTLAPNGFESNSVSGVTTGPGIQALGITNQTLGGAIASLGNSSNGNGVGLVLAACQGPDNPISGGLGDPGCTGTALALAGAGDVAPQLTLPSFGNLVQNNTLNSNLLYGLFKVGNYQPEEIAASAGKCATLTTTPPVHGPFTGIMTGAGGDAACYNYLNDNTWTGNGAGAPSVNGANVMDGTGWGGGCSQEFPTQCNGTQQLFYEGANATFPSTSNTTPFTLTVCNASGTPIPIKAGTEMTFYDATNGLSGTFFVTQTTIAQSNGTGNVAANCSTLTYPYTNLSLQALDPAKVGTDNSPQGQPYILGTGAPITININGAQADGGSQSPPTDTYGTGALANSCTPNGFNSIPNTFGTTNATNHPSSTTLDAGTGGVNASYDAC